MYHGHFAAGILLKAIYGPSIPAWPVMMGSSLLDIIGGLDALLGLTVITPSSARGPYMFSTFTFIDWEHSALMMLVWSSIFGWAVCHHVMGFCKEASMLGAASSILHWLMDILVVESTALTLYPYGNYHFGLGLYEKFPVLSWVLECILCAVLAGAAYRINKMRSGADISKACVFLGILSLLMGPWTSPLRLVAYIHETYGFGAYLRFVQTAGIWTAYIIPAAIFSKLLNEADKVAQDGKMKGKRGD
ncbi:hypothetical protein BKA65DRAFT_594400 [Rhexocercosporidium sp. MPI-PUGE-AT-0058]|nr:hypothetical protein BKA65DRAFT_594400 [Rhexocercosporidium sp. MPI-PUGE-AT-0058]